MAADEMGMLCSLELRKSGSKWKKVDRQAEARSQHSETSSTIPSEVGRTGS
jgi:hypothetical protein